MAALTYDVDQPSTRNRKTVGLRIIYAIPHVIVAEVWGRLAQILGVIQWFIVLFTGQRNQGIWDMQNSWISYYGRAYGYLDLLYDDPYPPFGTDPGQVPVRQTFTFDGSADRLTNALRIIWAIPALIIAWALGVASFVLLVISWFSILFTGNQSSGMYDFVRKALRFQIQTQSYVLLMTDTYPKYG